MVERDAQLEGGQPLLEATLDVIVDERLRAPHPFRDTFLDDLLVIMISPSLLFLCHYEYILSLRVHSVITSTFCHYLYLVLRVMAYLGPFVSLILVSLYYYVVLPFVFFSRAFQSRCYTIH